MAIIENSSSIGYRGFLYVTDGTNSFILPCTGAGLQPNPTMIVEDNIHGSGDDNAAFRTHYGEGAETYRGEITIPFFADAGIWSFMKNWILNDRVLQDKVISAVVSPDYVKGTKSSAYKYDKVYVSECRITNTGAGGGAGNFIHMTLTLEAMGRTLANDNDFPAVCTPSLNTNQASVNRRPVVYWLSKVTDYESFYGGTCSAEALSWDVRIANGTIVTHVLNLSKQPKYINQSLIGVTGDVVLFDPDGIPEPTSRSGKLTFEIYQDPTTKFASITLPNVFLSAYPRPMVAPRERVTRTLNFEAFAGKYDQDACGAAIILE